MINQKSLKGLADGETSYLSVANPQEHAKCRLLKLTGTYPECNWYVLINLFEHGKRLD